MKVLRILASVPLIAVAGIVDAGTELAPTLTCNKSRECDLTCYSTTVFKNDRPKEVMTLNTVDSISIDPTTSGFVITGSQNNQKARFLVTTPSNSLCVLEEQEP